MPNIFETVDPRGFKVICTEERWNDHILAGHSYMAGKEELVKAAIEKPTLGIFQDSARKNRAIYYKIQPNNVRYIKVVVDYDQDVGSVITAFPTDSGKSGEIMIWPT